MWSGILRPALSCSGSPPRRTSRAGCCPSLNELARAPTLGELCIPIGGHRAFVVPRGWLSGC
eukprot:6478179-Lingulodinium_polyedra.AAC.1